MKEKNQKGQIKSKISIRKIGSTILIVIGLLIITVPLIGKVIKNYEQQAMMEQFYLELENNKDTQIDEENIQLDETLKWGSDNVNQNEIYNNDESINNQRYDEAIIKNMPKPIGIIKINKINVNLPIAEGVELDVLNFAVGHMTGTAELGAIGNCVLAGHRSHTFGTFFNRLDELDVGDDIEIIKADGSIITYEVYKKILVEPDDLSVLNSSSKYKILTLITCHPEINATQRLIIHAIVK